MKLKITEITKREIYVEPPLYWKSPDDETYLGMLDNENAIYFTVGSYNNITHCQRWLKDSDIEKANQYWTAISEEIFMAAHEKLLRSMSLKPRLVINNQNDIADVL